MTEPLTDWLQRQALPLWAERGFDAARGSFVEALAPDGTPLVALDRRVLVQARQVHVFSQAALRGWPGLECARAGFDHMCRVYWHPQGGWIFSAAPDGTRRDDRRRTYDQAFALLACASYYRASGDAAALDWAARTLDALDRFFAHPKGGLREGLPDAPPRRQNPHMHLLEALLALHAASGRPEHLARARMIAGLFFERFYDSTAGLLHEEFDDSLRPLPQTMVEPGHHLEWVWLPNEYARATGTAPAAAMPALAATAWRIGLDPADGLVADGAAPDGTLRAPTKRIWPQCEALRAAATLDDRARAAAVTEALFRHHLAAAPGLWHERIGEGSRPIPGPVPATSLYHLFGAAVALADRR